MHERHSRKNANIDMRANRKAMSLAQKLLRLLPLSSLDISSLQSQKRLWGWVVRFQLVVEVQSFVVYICVHDYYVLSREYYYAMVTGYENIIYWSKRDTL